MLSPTVTPYIYLGLPEEIFSFVDELLLFLLEDTVKS